MIRLEDLCGKHIISGIEQGVVEDTGGNYVQFALSGITYRAVENPDDGYRSYMEDLVIVDGPCKFKLPDIEVVCHYSKGQYGDDNILEFYDTKNGKMILCIGTKDYNDYYPYCVMEYIPENMSCNAGKEATT